MADFSFNPSTQRYQWTSGNKKGQFVSKDDLDELVLAYNNQQADALQDITKRLLNKRIGVNSWIREVSAALKPAHINAYMVGIGGKAQMNSAEYGKLGAVLKEEYKYLRQFGRDILDKKLSRAQIEARINLYAESLYRSYEKGRESGHIANGFKWERRIRNASESCQDCIDYAQRGWVELGELPVPGDRCQCKRNCRCTKEYSNRAQQPANNILTLRNGWLGMTTKSIADTIIDSIAADVLNQVKGLTLEQVKAKLGEASTDQLVQLQQAIDDDGEMDDGGDGIDDPMMGDTDRAMYENGLYMGVPTDEDLAKINEMVGWNSTADQWFVFSALVSDNLMHLSWPMAWHLNVLRGIAKQLPGETLLTDHESSVDNAQGFWLRTLMTRDDNPTDEELDTFGNLELNKSRIEGQGVISVYALGVIPADNEKAIAAIKSRSYQDVSTGSLLKDVRHICPVCSERYGKEVEYLDKWEDGSNMCPHELPTPIMKILAEWGWLGENVVFMPYAIVDAEAQYHLETSFVYCGNLHKAQIVRK